jgi:hypothetical protein
MYNKQIKAMVREVFQEWNSQHTKALQKERAMRIQMYKDAITTATGIFIISLIPIIMLIWAGFTFLTGIFVTVFAVLIGVVIYMSIKEDNETREKRVAESLKQVN